MEGSRVPGSECRSLSGRWRGERETNQGSLIILMHSMTCRKTVQRITHLYQKLVTARWSPLLRLKRKTIKKNFLSSHDDDDTASTAHIRGRGPCPFLHIHVSVCHCPLYQEVPTYSRRCRTPSKHETTFFCYNQTFCDLSI